MSYGTACCLQALTGIRYSDWLACIPELRNLLKKAPYGSEAIKNFAGRMEGSDKGVGTAEEMVKFREWCNSPLKPLLSRK